MNDKVETIELSRVFFLDEFSPSLIKLATYLYVAFPNPVNALIICLYSFIIFFLFFSSIPFACYLNDC